MLIPLVAALECLLLSTILVCIAVIPAAMVGVQIPFGTQARMIAWGGVVVAVAAIAVNL